jgi:hypothetical protein
MDFDMGPAVANLRAELRELIKDHIPPDFLGAFTDNPGRPRGRPAILPGPLGAGSPVHGLASGMGRPRRFAVGTDGGPGGNVGAPRATRCSVHGRQLGGTDDHAPWNSRAAAAAPTRHRPGPHNLGVKASASQTPARTWRRCRRPPAAMGTAGTSPARRSGLRTPPGRSSVSCWPGQHGVRSGSTA